MALHISQHETVIPGPPVQIDCPKCGAVDVPAGTATVRELGKLFHAIPIFSSTTFRVRCDTCGTTFPTTRRPEELPSMTREALSAELANWHETGVDLFVKICVALGVVFGIVPLVGLIFPLIGIAATFRKRTGWRTAAIIGLCISLVANITFFLFVLLSK